MNDLLQSSLLTKEKHISIRIAVIMGLVQNGNCRDKIEWDVNGYRVLLKNLYIISSIPLMRKIDLCELVEQFHMNLYVHDSIYTKSCDF